MSVCELITAFLLFVQFIVSPKVPMLILAGTYLYSGSIIIPHLLSFPEISSRTGFMRFMFQNNHVAWPSDPHSLEIFLFMEKQVS